METNLKKLDEILKSFHFEEIEKKQKILDLKVFTLYFFSCFGGSFLLTFLSFYFSFLHHQPSFFGFIITLSQFLLNFSLSTFLFVKFENKITNMIFKTKKLNQLKTDNLKKVDKKFIFELMVVLEQLSISSPQNFPPYLQKLQVDIENSILDKDPQNTIILLHDFKNNHYDFIQSNLNSNKADLTKEFKEYKLQYHSNSNSQNTLEMNNEPFSKIFKSSL